MKRRWYDNADKTDKLAGISLMGLIAVWMVVAMLVSLQIAQGQRRTTMMEQTINLLTHEVGDCRINRSPPKS